MTIIYLTEYNTKCYAVTVEDNECVKVNKFEGILSDENIVDIKPMKNIFR